MDFPIVAMGYRNNQNGLARMYSSPKSSQYVCPSNQWSAKAFHQFLEDAVSESTKAHDVPADDRETVMLMVLQIWLDAAVPAGEG